MGTSSDDLFDKSGKNQNSLHYKYNKFLVSPYLPRMYNNSQTEQKEKKVFDDNKENEIDDDSLGETHIYYPKPNTYNSIYTQRFSKKYKNFYNNPNNYPGNKTTDNTFNYMYMNTPMKLKEENLNINPVKTPYYQIKKEIEYQKTPDKYNNNYNNNNYNNNNYNNNNYNNNYNNNNNYNYNNNNNYNNNKSYDEFEQNNIYNNYRRYDDYYTGSNKTEQRYKSPNLTKIAQNNFFNQDFNYNNHLFSSGVQDKRKRMYSLDKYS
jgi:hypothetical protein